MALISSAFSSTLNLCLKSQPSMSHTARLSIKELPLPHRKNPNAIVNQALTTKVEIPFLETRNFHLNLWEDNFLQPIPKHHHKIPSNAERCGRLISEVKHMFNSEKDVSQLLSLVDNIERLGIDRHFQKETKQALDLVYRNWGECQRDLNTTALGFRILRLHRYSVSPGALGAFRTENGHFFCSTTQSDEEKIKSVLNLYRASYIAFPGEKILDEAKQFSTTYLNETLQKTQINSNLLHEISFNLENGGYTNLPRLEAKKYIEIYEENSSWARMEGNEKLSSLAQMDFKVIRSMHQQELETFSRWWRDSGLCQLKFASRRHIEYFYVASAICQDEKYSVFRLGMAKLSAIAAYFDDTYHIYGTLDQLKDFTNAIKKWDPTAAEPLPKYMRVMYTALYETLSEIDQEAQKIQGQDSQSTSRDIWQTYIDVMMQEAEWRASGKIPSLVEYLSNEKIGSRAWEAIFQPLLRLDRILLENDIQTPDYPSRVNDLLSLCLKLKGDIKSFKVDVDQGEPISSISCYMRDNLEATKEDALNYVKNLLDEKLKELNWEFLRSDKVPTCSSYYSYDIIRGFLHFHRERDNFTISSKDIKDHVTQILFEPMIM